jgi:flagellar hook-basal body complex protein FliE
MPANPINGVALGPEFQIPTIEPAQPQAPADGQGFGQMLSASVNRLEGMLAESSQQSAALATGQAEDLTGVVLAVERAALGLQLAVQVRNKAVEAYQELFRMQI